MYIYIYKLAQHIRTISLDIYNVLQRNGTTPAGPLQKSKRLVRHWPRTSRSPLSHPSPPRILANLLPWLKSSNSRHHLYLYRCFVSGRANYIASPIRKTLDTVVNRIKRSFEQCFFSMYPALYTGSMPTQMPPHAYADCKGCLRPRFLVLGAYAGASAGFFVGWPC